MTGSPTWVFNMSVIINAISCESYFFHLESQYLIQRVTVSCDREWQWHTEMMNIFSNSQNGRESFSTLFDAMQIIIRKS